MELTPNNIARNTGYSQSYTSDRLQILVEHDFLKVDRNGDPFYTLTERGLGAIEGRFTVEELIDMGPEIVEDDEDDQDDVEE